MNVALLRAVPPKSAFVALTKVDNVAVNPPSSMFSVNPLMKLRGLPSGVVSPCAVMKTSKVCDTALEATITSVLSLNSRPGDGNVFCV